MSYLKTRIEAVLFAVSDKISLEKLAEFCREDKEKVLKELEIFQKGLDEKESALMLIEQGGEWKLTVRDRYLPFIKKVVSKTELTKGVMETLSIVAYKAPVRQSEIIRLRNNKAYDHLSELEKIGYVSRERDGRTRLVKLTQKFYDYFNIPVEQLKEKLKDFKKVEEEINLLETQDLPIFEDAENES